MGQFQQHINYLNEIMTIQSSIYSKSIWDIPYNPKGTYTISLLDDTLKVYCLYCLLALEPRLQS